MNMQYQQHFMQNMRRCVKAYTYKQFVTCSSSSFKSSVYGMWSLLLVSVVQRLLWGPTRNMRKFAVFSDQYFSFCICLNFVSPKCDFLQWQIYLSEPDEDKRFQIMDGKSSWGFSSFYFLSIVFKAVYITCSNCFWPLGSSTTNCKH